MVRSIQDASPSLEAEPRDKKREPGLFAQIQADWNNHGSDWTRQGFWALAVYRFGRWRNEIRFAPLRKLLSFFYRFSFKLVQICAGIELPCEALIGDGLRIDHFGGIIISCFVIMGRNCVLREGVTIGQKNGLDHAAPRLGDNVRVGPGAKIIGPVTIGSNVDIGPNAVINTDIPPDSIAEGNPARIVSKACASGGPIEAGHSAQGALE